MPKISIITVVLNDHVHIEKTIKSITGQSYRNYEYVVIDGGSTDGTLEKLQANAEQIDQLVSGPDKGLYDAMNKGMELASGEYLLFLNSGDTLAGDHILESIFASDSGADVIYGETNLVNENYRVLGTRSELTTRKLPAQLTAKDFLKGMPVAHQSFIIKKQVAEKYDLRYICSADIDWCIRVLKRSNKVVNSRKVISNFLIGGLSAKKRKTCWKERFNIYNKHFGMPRSLMAHIYIIIRYGWHRVTGQPGY